MAPGRRPTQLAYRTDEDPPPAELIVLGLEHLFVLATSFLFPVVASRAVGATPSETVAFVSATMLAVGAGTILQSLGRNGIGSGYLCPSFAAAFFLPVTIRVLSLGGVALLAGLNLAGGVLECGLSRVLYRVRMLFPPEVTGLVIVMAGVSVIPLAMEACLGGGGPLANGAAPAVAMLTLGVMVALSVWGKGRARLFSVLIGIAVGYAVAVPLGLVDAALFLTVAGSSAVSLPSPPIPSFTLDPAVLVLFLVLVFSGVVKAVGDLSACQRIDNPDWVRPDMGPIGTGILAKGIGGMVSGLLGGMAQTTSSANVGLTLATGAASRRIGLVAGAGAAIISFLPAVAAIFVCMPDPVIGAVLVNAAGFLLVTGFQIMTSRMMDARRIFVLGLSFFFGLSVLSVPDLYSGISNPILAGITASPLTLGTAIAIALTLVFRLGTRDYDRFEVPISVETAEQVLFAVEQLGERWGGRRDVFARAAGSLLELIQWAAALRSIRDRISVEARFDEYRLDLIVDERAFAGIPPEILAQYADRVQIGGGAVRLQYDH